jgi:hypothetical protein
MSRDQKMISADQLTIFIMVILNIAVIKYAFLFSDKLYSCLFVTFPLLFFLLFVSKMKKI